MTTRKTSGRGEERIRARKEKGEDVTKWEWRSLTLLPQGIILSENRVGPRSGGPGSFHLGERTSERKGSWPYLFADGTHRESSLRVVLGGRGLGGLRCEKTSPLWREREHEGGKGP